MDKIEGIIPPMVTPLKDEDTLDLGGIENLVDHLIFGGVHGIFLLGTTGEGPSLKKSLHGKLIKKVCDQVDSRIPVLVGLMDTSYSDSVYIANKAKELGAQALVLAPPSFYPIDQDGLYNFLDQLISEVSLPLYLYNNPSITKISFEFETVSKLLSRKEVLGIKDSSGDMIYYQKLKEYTDESDKAIFIGPEELLMESLLLGGNGGIPGGANIFPDLYVSIYESVKAGNLDRARNLQFEVMHISKIVYGGSRYGACRVINGIKSALKHLGICNDYVAKPLSKASDDKVKNIENWINTKYSFKDEILKS